MFRWVYHVSRIVFGAWFLYSGLAHFLVSGWQPMGTHQPAIAFTQALIVTMLANRLMPLTVIALVPLNVVICYWNFALDPAPVDFVFGILTIVFNAVLAWAWRDYFWPLLAWRGRPDLSLDLKLPETLA